MNDSLDDKKEKEPGYSWEKDFTKKRFRDKFNLSINEISELGIGWIIISFVILFITGQLMIVLQQGIIPPTLILYLFVLGISFFTHLFHQINPLF